jgi:hypothetical protein
MKQYLDHIKSKEPHERRQHAMQLAGAVTAAVFLVWITTLGMRLGSDTHVAGQGDAQTSLSASAAQSVYTGPNQLMVAPTSGF